MNRSVKIVLPCLNEGEWARLTCETILDRTDYPDYHVLVFANGDEQTDFSFVERPAFRSRVRLRRTEERLGVGNSINAAIEPGDAAYYVFLDAHCLVEQRDWLDRVVACLEDHPDCSMVQPEVLQFIYEGEPSKNEGIDESRIRPDSFAYSIRWHWPYQDPGAIATVETQRRAASSYQAMAGGGMAVFTRAQRFHELAGYDPEVMGWYPETMDYCIRAWLLGHPMIVDPTVRVLHRLKTGPSTDERSWTDIVQGVLRTAYKYLSPRRRDLAELLFRRHGFHDQVDEALRRIQAGRWLQERARHLGRRIHDDDWLFNRFDIEEERLGVLS